MYIGLISDTHGVFSAGFKEFLSSVDVVLHAGDFGGDEAFVEELALFKPLIAVYGNCDGTPVRLRHPRYQKLELEGMKLLMTHIGGSPGHYDSFAKQLIEEYKPDIFICGHSHILKVMRDRQYDMLYINPGAAGLQGWQVKRTALRFKLEAGKISEMEVFELDR